MKPWGRLKGSIEPRVLSPVLGAIGMQSGVLYGSPRLEAICVPRFVWGQDGSFGARPRVPRVLGSRGLWLSSGA